MPAARPETASLIEVAIDNAAYAEIQGSRVIRSATDIGRERLRDVCERPLASLVRLLINCVTLPATVLLMMMMACIVAVRDAWRWQSLHTTYGGDAAARDKADWRNR